MSSSRESDADSFWRWIQTQKLFNNTTGRYERFEYQHEYGDVIIQRVPDDFKNDSEHLDFIFDGGLFAVVNVYLDENLGKRFHSLIKYFDDNKFYQVDYNNDGNLRHPALLENLFSQTKKDCLPRFIYR